MNQQNDMSSLEPAYVIRLKERIDESWSPSFAPMVVIATPEGSAIAGIPGSRDELYRVLGRVASLGLHITSVSSRPVNPAVATQLQRDGSKGKLPGGPGGG